MGQLLSHEQFGRWHLSLFLNQTKIGEFFATADIHRNRKLQDGTFRNESSFTANDLGDITRALERAQGAFVEVKELQTRHQRHGARLSADDFARELTDRLASLAIQPTAIDQEEKQDDKHKQRHAL